MSFSASSDTPRRSLLAVLPHVRIHVISDEPVVRAGIRALLAARADNITFVHEAKPEGTDVVLYDVIGLRHKDGQELVDVLRRHPGRVLALARTLQPGLTARALELGAIAAVPLGAEAEQLLAAIQDLFEGRFQDGSAADLANRRDRDHRLGQGVCLSPREHQLLSLIVAGACNQEISVEMNVTLNTVKSFIRSTYMKIGVTSRSQAVAWGVDHGFPTRDPHR